MEKHSKIKKIMAVNVSDETFSNPFIPTKRKVTYWFNQINLLIFNNQLDKFKNVIITPDLKNEKGKIFAECEGLCDKKENHIAYLHLTDKFKNVQFFISILGHEMVHMHQWLYEGKMNHTKKGFLDPWKDKFAKHGIVLKVKY